MKVGFIGLGNMGFPMARNMLRAGHEVWVWNRTPERAEQLVSDGAHLAATPAEAARVGIVFTMLADDDATRAVVEGVDGILAGLPVGGVHVAASTLSVAFSADLARLHHQRDQRYVAAPVFGRPSVAEQGGLRIVAAGPRETLDMLRPLFHALGPDLFVVGEEPELAHAVKVIGNFLLTAMVEALCESFVLAGKAGIERARFAEVVNAVFRSPLVESYSQLLLAERFDQPAFRLRLGLKDVRLALALAEATATPLPLADLIRQHALEGVARGMSEHDFTALLRVLEAHAGIGPMASKSA